MTEIHLVITLDSEAYDNPAIFHCETEQDAQRLSRYIDENTPRWVSGIWSLNTKEYKILSVDETIAELSSRYEEE